MLCRNGHRRWFWPRSTAFPTDRRYMMGGFDPDLAVLNSMSLQRRVQIQMDRDKAAKDREKTLTAMICRRFGVDPEEFQ